MSVNNQRERRISSSKTLQFLKEKAGRNRELRRQELKLRLNKVCLQ